MEQILKGSCPFLYAWNGERYEFVTDVMWPDFDREDLFEAILDYQRRERRFGRVSAS